MSTVFLPFITEKSSEDTIFNAILKRTKGSSFSAIANLYSVVLTLGIEAVRKKVESYPNNFTTSDKIKELVAQHPHLHVKPSECTFWSCVAMLLDNKDNPKYKNINDMNAIQFAVQAVQRPESLSEIIKQEDYNTYKEHSENSFNKCCSAYSNIVFREDDSERVGFICKEEFKAFIAHRSLKNETTYVLPVMMVSKDGNEKLTPSDYANAHCKDPYGRI